MDQARNHSDFVGVVLIGPCCLEAEGQTSHRWRLLVQIVDCHFYVLWVGDDALLLTPGCLEAGEVLDLLDPLDGQPAWSLDASLQDEELEHALIGTK